MDDESGNCSGSGNSGSGSVIAGSERKRTKMGEEEQNLDEAIAEIVAVIDDQNKMIGMLIDIKNNLDFLKEYTFQNHNMVNVNTTYSNHEPAHFEYLHS